MWRTMLLVAVFSTAIQPVLGQFSRLVPEGFSGSPYDCYPADITPGYAEYFGPSCVSAADAVYFYTRSSGDAEDILYRITSDGAYPVSNPLTGQPISNVRSLRVGHTSDGVTSTVVGRSEIQDTFIGATQYVVWKVVGGVASVEATFSTRSGEYPQHSIAYGPVVGSGRTWWVHNYRASVYGSDQINLRAAAGDSTEVVPFDGCPTGWGCRIFDVTVLPNNVLIMDMEGPNPRLPMLDMGSGLLTRGPSYSYNHATFMSPMVVEGNVYIWSGDMAGFEGFYHVTPGAMTPVPWASGMSPMRSTVVMAGGTLYITDQVGAPGRAIWRLEPSSNTWVRVVDVASQYAYASTLGDKLVFFDGSTFQLGIMHGSGNLTMVDIPYQDYMMADVAQTKTLELDGWLYFRGTDRRQAALWRTDGSVVELVGEPSAELPINASRKTVMALMGVVDGKILAAVGNPFGTYPFSTELWVYAPQTSNGGGGGGGGTDPVRTTLSPLASGASQNIWSIDSVMPADSGFVFGPNMYADVAKAQVFSMPDDLSGAVESVDITWGYKASSIPAGATYRIQILNGSAASGPTGPPLGELTLPMASIVADADGTTEESAMTYVFDPPVAVGPTFFVSVDFGSYGASLNGSVALATGGYEGHRVPEVWEQWSNGSWANVSDAWLGGTDGWLMWMSAAVMTGQGVDVDTPGELPATVRLDAAYPNPFNPQTTVTWALDTPAPVRLSLFDALGREVRVLVDADRPAGTYHTHVDADGLASGVYLVRLETRGTRLTRQIILLK